MMTTYSIDKALEQQYDALGHPEGTLTEIRAFSPYAQVFCKNKAEFVAEAKKRAGTNLYVGINPRSEAKGVASAVRTVTCLVLDIDPSRPKDTPSTPEQHKSALELGKRITADLRMGFLVSSGSGCHVYIPIRPIRVENTDALTASIKQWMDAIRSRYATTELKIDSIHDLPRVIRVWGSHNQKSNRTCGPVGEVSLSRYDLKFEQRGTETLVAPSESGNCRFDALLLSDKRLAALVQGDNSYPSRSEADFAFISILAEAHFPPSEIKSLLKFNAHGTVCNPKPSDRKEDIDRDIKSVCEKVRETSKANSFSLTTHSSSYYSSLRSRSMGIRTGFDSLDEMISGLKKQKLYVLGARPNTGKTTLLTQVLTNLAEMNMSCLFYPTEVGSEPIFDKIVSRKTGINLKKFQNGSFLESDYEKIDGIRTQIEKLPLIVVEDFATTLDVIDQGIKKYAPSVVCVDYFQALKWNDPDSVGEKADAVRRFKQLAGDHDVPILLASQLNRTDEGKPTLKSLKATGALEEFGDVVAFLFRDTALSYPVKATLSVQKSKYSAVGDIPMDFFSSVCEFKEGEGQL